MCAERKNGKASNLPVPESRYLLALSLGVLEALAGAFLAVLFSLFDARVSHQESFLLERGAGRGIHGDESSRNGMPKRSGLSRRSAAVHGRIDRAFAQKPGQLKRKLNDLPQGETGESLFQRFFIDRDFAGGPAHPRPRDRAFSATRCIVWCHCHESCLLPSVLYRGCYKEISSGCCA